MTLKRVPMIYICNQASLVEFHQLVQEISWVLESVMLTPTPHLWWGGGGGGGIMTESYKRTGGHSLLKFL